MVAKSRKCYCSKKIKQGMILKRLLQASEQRILWKDNGHCTELIKNLISEANY